MQLKQFRTIVISIRAVCYGTLLFLLLPAVIQAAETSPQTQITLEQQRARALITEQQRAQILDEKLTPEADARPDSEPKIDQKEAITLPQGYLKDEQPCFMIKTIRYTEPHDNIFDFALKSVQMGEYSAINRCLGATGINQALTYVQNALVGKGYITTRVLAQTQDISGGELVFTLIPGRIHAVRFTDDSSKVSMRNALPQFKHDMLNLRVIEQGLENLKRVPTADADIKIYPASELDATVGESDIVISHAQNFPIRFALSLDDSGSEQTGKYQSSTTVSLDNLLKWSDLFYASYNHNIGRGKPEDGGTNGYTMHYSIPYDYYLLSLNTNKSNYFQAIARSSAAQPPVIYSGESTQSDIELSRLIFRNTVSKSKLSLKGFTRTSHNFLNDVEIAPQQRRTAGYELRVNHNQNIGGAQVDLALAFKKGTGMLGAKRGFEEAENRGTSRFGLFLIDASLTSPVHIGQFGFGYQGVIHGQINQTKLVAQDQFSIGNRFTVRGFDGKQTLLAKKGVFMRNTFSAPIQQLSTTAYVGLDYGQVSGDDDIQLTGALVGTVLGVKGQIPPWRAIKGISYDIFVGRPLMKPSAYEAQSTTAGFSLFWSY